MGGWKRQGERKLEGQWWGNYGIERRMTEKRGDWIGNEEDGDKEERCGMMER